MVNALSEKYSRPVSFALSVIYFLSVSLPVYAAGYRDNSSIKNIPNEKIQEVAKAAGRSNVDVRKKRVPVTVPNSGKGFKKFFVSGPGQPEMASFKSAGADNMVNLFTGDFSYNIPLLDVDGYPVNIFYNAGITMDQEASWVGLGWNLNPGTVSRQMRGLPDDFDGSVSDQDKITKESYIKPNITAGLSQRKNIEIVGFDIGTSKSIEYNTYTGFGIEFGKSVNYNIFKTVKDESTGTESQSVTGIGGSVTLSSKNGLSFRPTFSQSLNKLSFLDKKGNLSTSFSYNSRTGLQDFQLDLQRSYKLKADQPVKDNMTKTYSRIGVSAGFSHNFATTSFVPSIRMPVSYRNFNLTLQIGTESPVGVFKPNLSLGGYYSQSFIKKSDRVIARRAYGYLNMQAAKDDADGLLDFNRTNDNGIVPGKTPVISVPQYTYDVFSISGEGTGGTFRAYRGDIGYVRDAYVSSKSIKGSGGLDLASSGPTLNVGVTLDGTSSKTFVSEWQGNNLARGRLGFEAPDGAKEPVYFRNPGEMSGCTDGFYDLVGGERLARIELLKMGNILQPLPVATEKLLTYSSGTEIEPDGGSYPLSAATGEKAQNRDRRSQVISYLTAREASRIGLDRYIKSYGTFNKADPFPCENGYSVFLRTYSSLSSGGLDEEGQLNYRQPNHISEIDVVEQDGKRYIYGLPVYNETQKDVTFAVKGNASGDIVSYENGDDALGGGRAGTRDKYFSSETTPAYAHSFLLTGLLSADYSDVKGDGITDDDIGTAVKFNYKRVGYSSGTWGNYTWRTPVNTASNNATYNQGLKTDERDDKAFYSYGRKELWYTHSIESKSMVAVFYTSDREDGLPAEDEGGKVSDGSAIRLQRLDKIELYSKSDLVRRKAMARPVKTVHFEYDYSLCGNVSNSAKANPSDNSENPLRRGKLTLKSVWFSYNGASGHRKNQNAFRYNNSYNGKEFTYNRPSHDSWGNLKTDFYKSILDEDGIKTGTAPELTPANPVYSNGETDVQMLDGDYPFPIHAREPYGSNAYLTEKEAVDAFAGAWSLAEIDLPSGATIKVDYESDEYAYVQDRPAAEMMRVAGFAQDGGSEIKDELYSTGGENNVVFFDVPEAVEDDLNARKNINKKYLNGIEQLLLKLYVKVRPSGGYEPVVVYAAMSGQPGDYDCGVVSADNKKIWVRLDTEYSLVDAVFQFLRDQVPGQVYPGSDVSGESVPMQLIKSLVGMLASATDLIGDGAKFKIARFGKEISVARSFGRLTNPVGRKWGGGHRVRRVRITDNWDKLTTRRDNGAAGNLPQPEMPSEYGQEYLYTTNENSGTGTAEVSSGVATYEPSSAGEENPFREMLVYKTKNRFLGPSSYGSTEMPVAEAFYPSAMVGYSKVRVRSVSRRDNKGVRGAAGIQETQFYTSKDFPTLSDYTPIVEGQNYKKFKPDAINFFLKFFDLEYVTISQGFRVQLNNMNGKIREQSTYSEGLSDHPVASTKYIYKTVQGNPSRLDNRVSVVKDAGGVTEGNTVGKDIEVMVDFREHNATSYSGKLNANLEVQFPFIFIPDFYIPVAFDQSIFRSVAVMKVVNTYGILEKVEAFDKGSNVRTENVAYDRETGEPLLTSVTNMFDQPVYSFNYPAYWAYGGMGPAYKNIGAQAQHVFIRNGFIESGNKLEFESLLHGGDELYVEDAANGNLPENPSCGDCGSITRSSGDFKVWAVDLSGDNGYMAASIRPERWLFLDRAGNPYNGGDVYMRVVRSGRRNMLAASIGGVSTLIKNPLNDGRITFGTPDALSANAAVYKETWKGEDAYFSEPVSKMFDHFYPLHSVNVPIDKTMNVTYYNTQGYAPGHHSNVRWLQQENENSFGVRHWSNREYANFGKDDDFNDDGLNSFRSQRSWVTFDLSGIPSEAVVNFAKFNLSADNSSLTQTLLYRDGSPFSEYVHYAANPHKNLIGATNVFSVEPMKTPWGITTSLYADDSWENRFLKNKFTDNLHSDISSTTTPEYSAQSFLTTEAIDVSTAFSTILADRLAGRNFAPGFKLKLVNPSNYSSANEKRQFFKKNNLAIPPTPTCIALFPRMDGPSGSEWSITYKSCETNEWVYLNGITGEGIFPQLICAQPTSPSGLNVYFEESPSNNCPGEDIPGTPESTASFINLSYYLMSEECGRDGQPPCVGPVINRPVMGTQIVCFSKLDQQFVNPYVLGYIGNWRPFKSYSFYSDRKESSVPLAGVPSNVSPRTDGTLKEFEPFWLFDDGTSDNKSLTASNSSKWVWSSAVSQVNRRGMELESYDPLKPLQRYNSAIYGYNGALPVAVVNNSRYSESAFDGFEDYGFSDQLCNILCKPARHWDLGNLNPGVASVSGAQHHSGSYSLKIEPGKSLPVIFPAGQKKSGDPEIVTGLQDKAVKRVSLDGSGLDVTFMKDQAFISSSSNSLPRVWINSGGDDCDDNPSFDLAVLPGVPPSIASNANHVKIKWSGNFYVEETGAYQFRFTGSDDRSSVAVFNSEAEAANPSNSIGHLSSSWTGSLYHIDYSTGFNLEAGKRYWIMLTYENDCEGGNMNLEWHRPCLGPDQFEPINKKHFYPKLAVLPAETDMLCKPDMVSLRGEGYDANADYDKNEILIDRFSPVPGSKMVLSAWVKEGEADCVCSNYTGNSIQGAYTNEDPLQSPSPVYTDLPGSPFSAAGGIIEGWQRYEAVIDIPPTATFLRLGLMNNSSVPVFFDDIRMHPYNANMKSFVYDPVSLRLKAELDENNYASYYEYDDEGTLARVKKETVRGIKTIRETRAAMVQPEQAPAYPEPDCPEVTVVPGPGSVTYSFNSVGGEVDQYAVGVFQEGELVGEYEMLSAGPLVLSGSFEGLTPLTGYTLKVFVLINSRNYFRECAGQDFTSGDQNFIDGMTSITPGNTYPAPSGSIHIATPAVLRLSAYGGSGGSTVSVTIGSTVYQVTAAANQSDFLDINLGVGDHPYSLSATFGGSSGNSGTIAF